MYPKITLQKLQTILNQRFEDGFLTLRDLPNPSTLKDMDKATTRIVEAIKKNQKIYIIGDYDVDGVVSTTLMKLFFDHIDYDVSYIIPNRFSDGYGLSSSVLDRVYECDLIITVDNGISAYDASLICEQRGIELIVTDHHLLPPKLPKAYAIIDQKQDDCTFPYDEICGAQIAWYLIASLKRALNLDINMIELLEFCSLAIIADMMPLLHINRVMTIAGIKAINTSNKAPIKAIKEHLDKEVINSEDIAFFIAPVLNSAGRMEDASFAVDFLLSSNIYDARSRLQKLLSFNEARKDIEASITKEAIAKASKDDDIIVVDGKKWHEGVVGIVAARVGRELDKPCIILTKCEEDSLKGSGRSFCECNLFDVVGECREILTKFGGHSAAIGLSLKSSNLDTFRKKLQEIYKSKNYQKSLYDSEIVGEIDFRDISFEMINLIKEYEPFGMGNPAVKFIAKNVEVLSVDTMGKDAQHQRFAFKQNGVIHIGVKFKSSIQVEPSSFVDITFNLNENSFRGEKSIQLFIDKIIINYR